MATSIIKILTVLAALGLVNLAQATERPDLTTLSLEELMSIEVTSVSKQPQRISDAAAAVFIITQDAIRRSGATSIPELLRIAPGVQVARIDANKWAISIRGFNSRFATKLLVLMDGRSVYTPLFSGVYWDVQDTVLEDIERIEVIRGPGGALWGANAVNGVINIITKQAQNSQGGLAGFTLGNEERATGVLRYGGKSGADTYYRLYAKYFDRDPGARDSGATAADSRSAARAGGRMDTRLSATDSLTLQGDIYRGNSAGEPQTVPSLSAPYHETIASDVDVRGVNLLGRWRRQHAATAASELQVYYDRNERDDPVLDSRRETLDVDFQNSMPLTPRQNFLWGLGYRYTRDRYDGGLTISLAPKRRHDHLYSGFVQDQITLRENLLRLTLGAKFEHNDSTGFEVQPSVRLLWTPGSRHSYWAAVSRVVRTPSRGDQDMRINSRVIPGVPGTPPTLISLFGNPDVESERLISYELGWRGQLSDRLGLDFTAFYNDYSSLRSLEPGMPFFETEPAPPHMVVPLIFASSQRAQAFGFELAADWRIRDDWRLQGQYSYLDVNTELPQDSSSNSNSAGNSPRHQIGLRSSLTLRHDLDLDITVRYVDKLPLLKVAAYTALDARLAWRPHKDVELSLVGQNLFDNQHAEFGDQPNTVRTETERSLYVKLRRDF